MLKVLHQATATEITNAASTVIDWVSPVSGLAIVYYLMVNMPIALGMNKDVKRKTSHS